MDLAALERRALELAKAGDFGPEAARINAAIAELAPTQQSAWTRLGRCHLEQRQFDEAVVALRAALSINPENAIATRLLAEVRKQRALTPTAVDRTMTGFTAREFAILETLSPADACARLAPRLDALVSSINASTVAERIVAARQRAGYAGSKLFHAGSCHAREVGHIYTYHYGGRWEPQFNLGWFSSPPYPRSCVRVGLGFNAAGDSQDPDRAAGQERVLAYFDRFTRTLDRAWKRELAQWMGGNGGFLQYGSSSPAIELSPERAVEWILSCRNLASIEWVFIGRWLFLDRPADAAILADRSKLARVVDDTFRTLFPLWVSAYASDTSESTPQP
jgi:hypothetical protein